jgi:hypothetical protein
VSHFYIAKTGDKGCLAAGVETGDCSFLLESSWSLIVGSESAAKISGTVLSDGELPEDGELPGDEEQLP